MCTMYTIYSIFQMMLIEHFQCSLNDISCFPFKNYLQTVKKMVRNSHNTIAQVTKCLKEVENAGGRRRGKKSTSFIVSSLDKDRCFFLKENTVAYVQEKRGDGLVCNVLKKRHVEVFFKEPVASTFIDVGYVRENHRRMKRKLLTREQILRKAVYLPYRDGGVVFPLLHGQK